MPVDAVALAGVITAPTVTGVVAIIIHRQRLAHERRQTDLAAVRELLKPGADLLGQLDDAAHAWFVGLRTEVRDGRTQPQRFRALRESHDAWRSYTAGLCLMFESRDDIARAATRVVETSSALIGLGLDPGSGQEGMGVEMFSDTGEAMDRFVQAVPEWERAARAVARARL